RETRRNVYVRSPKAGERLMWLLRHCYGKLRLKINDSKSTVTLRVRSRPPTGSFCVSASPWVCGIGGGLESPLVA
ncbi:MAG: hypothetical protein ABJ077_17745, partial [Marinobacter sp.]